VEVEIGTKSLARAAVGGVVRATVRIVLGVGRHRPCVDMHWVGTDMTENNKGRNAKEQPGRQAGTLHC